MSTEFGNYLRQCPTALNDKNRTMWLLKDALNNDLPKFRVLQAAYELGVVDAIRRSNPISTDDRLRITTGLVSQYAMLETAAKHAIDYWESSIDADILVHSSCETDVDTKAVLPSPVMPSSPARMPDKDIIKVTTISQDFIRLGIRLQWEKRTDIDRYELWRAKGTESPVKIKNGTFPIPRYQDCDVEPNVLYAYAIRGTNESEKSLAHSPDLQLVSPSKPPVFQIREVQFAFSGVQIKWTMIFEATSYRILRFSDTAGWQTLAELPITQTMYLDSAVQNGNIVKYKIQCICKNNTLLETTAIEVNL